MDQLCTAQRQVENCDKRKWMRLWKPGSSHAAKK